MKRKFAGYSFILAAMTAAAAYSFQPPGNPQGYAIPPGQKGPTMEFRGPDVGWSQVNQPVPQIAPQPNQKNYLAIMNKDRTVSVIEKEPGAPFTPEEMEQSHQLRMELQSALATIKSPDSDDAQRKEMKLFVAQYLKAEFKRDQTMRRDQVERLEKQVEQLKKQLAKRDESQDKLIELRLQLLENDASGLSFPETWANFSNNPGMSGPYPPPLHTYPSNNPYGAPFQPFTTNVPGPGVNPGVSQFPNPNSYPVNNFSQPKSPSAEVKKR